MIVLENGLIAFNIIGGAICVCVCGIIAYKRKRQIYKWLLFFELALLFYAACILMVHREIDTLHEDPAPALSVITNYAFLLVFLFWKCFLSVRKKRSEITKRELVMLVLAMLCAVFWTIDSIFFTKAFVIQNLLGNITSTVIGVAFAIMVIVCYIKDLRDERNRIIWVVSITLMTYITYIQYIDISTCTNVFNPGVLQVITVHTCLTSCAVISFMILVFALYIVAREIGVDEDQRSQITVQSLKEEYGISTRELEVLELIYRGASNQEIAEELFISENTVKKHINSILRKLSVSNRVDLLSTYKFTHLGK